MTPPRPQVDRRRIAVVAAGDPGDPTVWSGTPRGLVDGITGLGYEAVPVSALPSRIPRRLHTMWIATARRASGMKFRGADALAAARYGEEWARLLSRTATRRRRGLPVDGVIQAGEGWIVDHPRTAIYFDMTTHQGIGHGMFGPSFDLSALDSSRRRAADQAFAAAAAICGATPWAVRSAIEDHGADPSRSRAVGIGSRPQGLPARIRDMTIPHLLFVASRWHRKHGPTVIEAFRRLRAAIPEATLDVVGEHPLLDEPGVTTHGFLARADVADQQRLALLFQRATCLVVPGSFEAAGIVFVEAAHQGIPSLCGATGGAKDIVGPGGISVAPGDPDALHRALLEIIQPHRALRAGEAARSRASHLTWPSVARRVLQTLDGESVDESWWT